MTQNANEDELRRLIDERIAETLKGADPGSVVDLEGVTEIDLDDVLGAIDPRDSESALKLFAWLQKNGRLHRTGSLDGVGYLFVYQEPQGASREGYTAGGTQGDRIVDQALEKAEANGGRALKGLCRKCFSAVSQKPGEEHPTAESPRPDEDPLVCTDGGPHAFAS